MIDVVLCVVAIMAAGICLELLGTTSARVCRMPLAGAGEAESECGNPS